jgi:hypothetical protein
MINTNPIIPNDPPSFPYNNSIEQRKKIWDYHGPYFNPQKIPPASPKTLKEREKKQFIKFLIVALLLPSIIIIYMYFTNNLIFYPTLIDTLGNIILTYIILFLITMLALFTMYQILIYLKKN